MRRHIIPFFAGFIVASVLFFFLLLPWIRDKNVEWGRQQGERAAKLELMQRLPKVLGDDYDSTDGYNVFFTVKADAVVVVERNGVKTLRTYVSER